MTTWSGCRPTALRLGRGLSVGLAGWTIVLGAVRAEPTPDGPPAAVLELAEGGVLPGQLRPAARPGDGHAFAWESPLFAAPLEFPAAAIVRMQFPQDASAERPPPAGWRIDLSGGDTVCGRIVALHADMIEVDCPAAAGQPLRLRRSWIERMTRVPDRGTLLVPGDRGRWQTAGKAWRIVAGRPIASDPGSAIWLAAEQPPRVCLEMVLSWQDRPDLRIDLCADAGWMERLVAGQAGAKSAATDEYRLEFFSGRLLGIREGRAAKFDELLRLPEGPGRLRLQVFVDRTAGRLAIRLPAARTKTEQVAFDATVPPRGPPRETVGCGLKLRSGDIRIEELTIIPWTEDMPRLQAGASVAMATIESFDAATDEFVVRADGQPRRVAAQSVGDITDEARVQPARIGDLTVVAPGLRLTGRIAALTDTEISCDAPALLDRVVLARPAVSALEAPAIPGMEMLPGRVGWLESGSTRVLGCIANAGRGQGIGWQPAGAVAAVPLAAGATARIDYSGGARVAGAGIEPIRQGQGWGVAVLVPQGPAARYGRIREGWMIETITQLPGGNPVQARTVKNLDTLRSLLRGMPGSAVEVSFTNDTGGMERAVLIRDASGRGDLAGAAEADVLDKVLRVHAEQARPAVDDARWPAVIFLVTGDSLRGQVRAANSAGLEAELEVGGVVTILRDALRAVELRPAGVKPLPRQKMDRLLTLPRMQRDRPPTHLLRTVAGDYIRGRLVSLDEEQVTLELLQEKKSFPRSDVARIIWLAIAGSPRPPAAGETAPPAPGMRVQVVTAEGRRLTLGATGVDAGILTGHSAACGPVRVDTGRCERILVGGAIEEFAPAELPYSQWVLREAGR